MDETKKIAAGYWKGLRIVKFVSSSLGKYMTTIKRQIGPHTLLIECPNMLMEYQVFMGNVDTEAQSLIHCGGFANKAHFRKWYKSSILQ